MKATRASNYLQRTQFNRRQMLAGAALSAAGLSAPSLLAACSQNATASSQGGGQGLFPDHPKWTFVFICHATTNPFFVPTQYGIQDAAALLGCGYQWTGSQTTNVSEMINAFNAAVAAKVDGIVCSLVDANAFNEPVQRAMDAGIPVVAFNADVPPGVKNSRYAYVGQDLFLSGVELGQRIVSLVPQGDIAGFIATPGSLNIQPRIDGCKQAIKSSGKPINFVEIATGARVEDELAAIEAYYLGHKSLKGMIAVDAGSTQGLGQIMEKYKLSSQGIHAGGYDMVPKTIQEVQLGNLDFTIDQQPYQQGFVPMVQLFLFHMSGGLQVPSNTNTGLVFITKDNVAPFISTQTRFEGSSAKQQLVSPVKK